MTIDERSVLVVDDDKDIRETLTELLGEEGLSVVSVENGHEATKWIRCHIDAVQVVLLDLMMPVMDGNAFLLLRQTDPLLRAIPVIVMTAGPCDQIKRRTDVADCIPKPMSLPRLLAAIQTSTTQCLTTPFATCAPPGAVKPP